VLGGISLNTSIKSFCAGRDLVKHKYRSFCSGRDLVKHRYRSFCAGRDIVKHKYRSYQLRRIANEEQGHTVLGCWKRYHAAQENSE